MKKKRGSGGAKFGDLMNTEIQGKKRKDDPK